MNPLLNRCRRYVRLVGPWPIEPFYLGFLTFFMVASLYSLGENVDHSHTFGEIALRPIFSTVIAYLTMGQLILAVRIFKKYIKNIWIYISILVVQSFSIWSWIVLFRELFPQIHSSFTAFLSPLPVFRFFFTLACINAFIGLSRARLSTALSEKEEILKVVENQSALLLQYDEKTRAELSEFLHDRVQSSLVTACLELQEIRSRSNDGISEDISKVINALENLRAVEVRNASQTLSPAIGNADLATSIKLMADSYAPQIKVKIQESPNLDDLQRNSQPELFLGIYRIIEQAFLNAHIHGNAKAFEISFELSQDALKLTLINDGAPLAAQRGNGLGSAIINSWARNLDGEWSITNTPDGKVALTVEFAL